MKQTTEQIAEALLGEDISRRGYVSLKSLIPALNAVLHLTVSAEEDEPVRCGVQVAGGAEVDYPYKGHDDMSDWQLQQRTAKELADSIASAINKVVLTHLESRYFHR